LGKTSPQAVDKFKRDCGISGGYLKRKIFEKRLKLFWEVTAEIKGLPRSSEDFQTIGAEAFKAIIMKKR
jgi:hypothetical protein